MGGACSAHRTDEKCVTDFGRKKWREENFEDIRIYGKTILE